MTNSQAADHDRWLVRCSPVLRDLAKAISITTFMVWKNNIGKGGGGLKIFLKDGESKKGG